MSGVQDLLNMAGGFQQIANRNLDIKEKLREQKEQEALQLYTGELQKDPNWMPDPGKPDYNPIAFQKARIGQFELASADENFKTAQYQRIRQSIDAQHEQVYDAVNKAEALISTGDLKAGLKQWEAAYENFADGVDMEISDDGKSYTLTHRDGTKETRAFESPEALISNFRIMAKQGVDRTEFAKLALANRFEIVNQNTDVMANPEVLTDGKGNVIFKYVGLIDPNTGIKQPPIYEQGGVQISEVDVKKAHFVPLKDQKQLAEITDQKAQTRIRLANADADKRGISAAAMSPEQKLARYIAEVNQIDERTALDWVMDHKDQNEKLRVLAEMLEYSDLKDPAVQSYISNSGLNNMIQNKALSTQLSDTKKERAAAQHENRRIEAKVGGLPSTKSQSAPSPKTIAATPTKDEMQREMAQLIRQHGREKAIEMMVKKYPNMSGK